MNQYDEHTILIKHQGLDDDMLKAILKKEIRKVGRSNGNFTINNIKNYKDELLGIAFAYLADSRVYYTLIGKNPDGTERVVYESDLVGTSGNGRWADMVDVEKKIERVLEPLIQVDDRIEILPAYAMYPEERFQSNVLYSAGVDDDVTPADIWRVFSKFVPGAYSNGETSYPRVHINRDKHIAIVKFREESNHAIFALHMCKSLRVKNCCLRFRHAFAK